MKTILNILGGILIIVVLLGLSLLILKYALEAIFIVFDYNNILGGVVGISLLILFIIIAGIAKTREYFPSLRQITKRNKTKEN